VLTLLLAAAGILGVGTLRPHAPSRRSSPTRTPTTGATTGATTPPGTATRAPAPSSPDKLLGQRIMVGVSGTSPSRALVGAVRAGHIGSVILFAPNLVSRSQALALTGALQRAARAGGNPGLLISVDQEGGQVKRLPAGPPTLAPPQMAATGNPGVAGQQGAATAHYLRRWGINMDLAPVADVPTFGGAFIWRQGRAFSFNAGRVAEYAAAFASGLQSGGVAATAKHFPGLGSAATDTDFKRQELTPSAAQRRAALTPYQRMIARGLDAVMLSTAGFPAYDATGSSAALSAPIGQQLLRGRLGFRGVTITDALGTPTGHDERTAGLLAARAGADILLYTDSAPGELATLQSALRTGRISTASATASYQRILALKHTLGLA
jgi:beta-N-acetylhexosaminidase